MIGIYSITSPSGKIYIGQSTDIDKRFIRYKNLDCKLQKKIYHSLLKYGFDSHKFEVIVSGDFNQQLLNELEIHYIRLYNSFSNGLNLTAGGLGSRGRIVSEHTRKKISDSNKGKPSPNKGKSPSEETRRKISEKKKNYVTSEETKKKLSLVGGRKVIDTSTGIVYSSGKKASDFLKVNHNTFLCWMIGKRKNKTTFRYLK